MKEALALIQAASPGANVHLFTTKHDFDVRIGLSTGSVSMYGAKSY
jgi:hypothetical protein